LERLAAHFATALLPLSEHRCKTKRVEYSADHLGLEMDRELEAFGQQRLHHEPHLVFSEGAADSMAPYPLR
jgi:hypothetical protein